MKVFQLACSASLHGDEPSLMGGKGTNKTSRRGGRFLAADRELPLLSGERQFGRLSPASV